MDEKEKTMETLQEAPVQNDALPAWKERVKKRFADRSFESDEDWDNAAEEAFASDEKDLQIFRDNDQVIDELLASDKDLARIVSRMIIEKVPFRIAADGYLEAPKEGDDDYDYYQKSHEERLAIGRQLQDEARQRLANEAETYKAIDAYCEDQGYDEEAEKEFISYINSFYNSLSMKQITPQMLSMIDKARTYEQDVQAAHDDGVVEGRNTSIEAKMSKSDGGGDGIPRFSGGGETPDEPRAKKKSFFSDMKPTMKF